MVIDIPQMGTVTPLMVIDIPQMVIVTPLMIIITPLMAIDVIIGDIRTTEVVVRVITMLPCQILLHRSLWLWKLQTRGRWAVTQPMRYACSKTRRASNDGDIIDHHVARIATTAPVHTIRARM